ncbi:hypothetical protein POPTR_011G102500v4 [Populus trichocarpa]|uniref:Uncharacterized protein n=1 Tax=Populus trichocarpa TaxID=3694 RepID=A0ACC0S963_POPTR|nr:hypothetical protein POPTR_011G102500v4 [Populus trichocarpa]
MLLQDGIELQSCVDLSFQREDYELSWKLKYLSIQYTRAIDIWSIGCIFAEVLTGKPLFPGKSVVHQLDLITDLLGTPSLETISRVRNDKARKYLTEMRKKQPVPFAQKFPNADPSAHRLLQRLLAFDPKDRPTAEEALADPYFKGLAKVEREPSCQPITKLEFEFERRRVTKEDVRELLYREILEYHPQLLKDYMNGNESTNFLYPSAIGHFRKQFAYLEENSGRSAPVIPLERKHVSLPRSTVHSNTMPPNMQSNSTSFDNRQVTEDASKNLRVQDTSFENPAKVARPPPRMPSAKPGRVVGSVVPYENGRNVKDLYDTRMFCRNAVLPPQTSSPHCFLRTNTLIQEKSISETGKDSQTKQQPPKCNVAAKPSSGMAMDVNTNPYYQPQSRVEQLNERIAIDAKLLQAQSQFGPVGRAAVAAHRNVGTVHYGLT